MAGNRTGYNADLTIGGYEGASLESVEVSIDGSVVDCSDLSDTWRENQIDAIGWTLTGTKKMATEAFLTLLTSNIATSVGVKITDPLGSVVFSGAGFINRAGMNISMEAAITETISVTGQGEPSNP